MTCRREFRTALTLLLATSLACTPARALVTFNDSHDHIFVTETFAVSRDSNIFANSDNAGDTVYNLGLSAEYTRRAGWIGVNGGVSVGASRFGKHTSQNFNNPGYSLELTKQSGRTTGSFTISGARESRADAAVNMRSTSWNYNTGLNVKYPAGINTFTGTFGYSSRKYVDETFFTNLATYSASMDVIHVLPAQREFVGGYRYRYGASARNTATTDHGLSGGISGKLLRGVNGSIRAGYQTRISHAAGRNDPLFHSWTLSGSTTYALTQRLKLALQASKDFSTTATDSSVDAISASVDTSYTFNRRVSVNLTSGWGNSHFLGENGRIVLDFGPPPILGQQRNDTYANWTTGLSLSLTDRLKSVISYSWFENWSTSQVGDFIRTSWSANLSSRW